MISKKQNKKRIMNSWQEAWLNGYKFSGRTGRYDFWAFMFVNLIIFLMCFSVAGYFQLNRFFWYAFLLILACPLFSISVRRLHDANYSGKWVIPLAILAAVTLADFEFSFFNAEVSLYLTLAYATFLLWLLDLNGKRFGNKYGAFVMEKNGAKTQNFLQHLNAGFLIGIWVAYFFYLFITKY